MSKHTPGPWKVSERSPELNVNGILGIAIDLGTYIEELATVWASNENDTEAFANARLIAAAPEMYELLQEIKEMKLSYDEVVGRFNSLIQKIIPND